MKRRNRSRLKVLGGAILALVALELALRLFFGFGHLPVYYTSPKYEYALRPSQDLNRFGHRFFINDRGMRSDPLADDEIRVLKFGDSVLNGGVQVDNDSLCSTLLENQLKALDSRIRALNVSAGSWGPGNAYAWMKQHGDFDAKAIVLVFSSHDWVDTMTFRDVVGRVPFYPAHQPVTAIGDAVSWVYSRYFQKVDWSALPVITHEADTSKNPGHSLGWIRFYRYGQDTGIPVLVYHHVTQKELHAGHWNKNGLALETFLKDHNIESVSGFDAGFVENDFLDNIHLSSSGHRKLAGLLLEPVKETLHGPSELP